MFMYMYVASVVVVSLFAQDQEQKYFSVTDTIRRIWRLELMRTYVTHLKQGYNVGIDLISITVWTTGA